MTSHGKQIMQAVTLILEAEHSIEVKEQVRAVCRGGLSGRGGSLLRIHNSHVCPADAVHPRQHR